MDFEKSKKRIAFIYTGGKVKTDLLPVFPNCDETRAGEECLIIAADSGYDLCRRLGIVPDVLIGDMDSVKDLSLESFHGEYITSPREKNDTDTMLAVKLALERGFGEIFIIGGLGGRVDHSLSNLYILEYIYNRGCKGVLTDGQNRVIFLRGGTVALKRGDYRFFSLLAVDTVCRGVTVAGCRYPLSDAVLLREEGYAVSNEIVGDEATLSVDEGALFVIESRD